MGPLMKYSLLTYVKRFVTPLATAVANGSGGTERGSSGRKLQETETVLKYTSVEADVKMNVKCCFVLIIIFGSYCVLVHGKYTLNQLEGTWIVRNTSEVDEKGTCPFVKIYNAQPNGTATLKYITDKKKFTFNITTTNIITELLDQNGSSLGNLSIFKGYLPYYMLIRINNHTKGGFSPYMVLTGNYQLPKGMDKNITQFWNTNNATRNVTLYPTGSHRTQCDEFLAISGYPAIPPDYSNVTAVVIGDNPMDSGTTQKPKIPKNSTNHLKSNILLTMILAYSSLYARS